MVHNHPLFATLTCSGPVTWTANIETMFTTTDVTHMKQATQGALDLSSYDSVKMWAAKIYSVVSSGAMPPPGSGENPWTPAMVNTFGCWIQQNCPK